MNDEEMIRMMMERHSGIAEFNGLIKTYSDEELLIKGREFASLEDYARAFFVFSEGRKRNRIRDLSVLFLSAVKPVICSNAGQLSNIPKCNKCIIDKLMSCMVESTTMHGEKKLSDSDLALLETLVDRVPYQARTIYNRAEFQRFYENFKMYSIKVSLGEK